jgi:hypothetical protein
LVYAVAAAAVVLLGWYANAWYVHGRAQVGPRQTQAAGEEAKGLLPGFTCTPRDYEPGTFDCAAHVGTDKASIYAYGPGAEGLGLLVRLQRDAALAQLRAPHQPPTILLIGVDRGWIIEMHDAARASEVGSGASQRVSVCVEHVPGLVIGSVNHLSDCAAWLGAFPADELNG